MNTLNHRKKFPSACGRYEHMKFMDKRGRICYIFSGKQTGVMIMADKGSVMSNHSEIIIYQTQDGLTKIDVAFDDETVWLSLDQMAQLFQRDKSVISRHIKNIYAEGELSREGTVAKNATVQKEGTRNVERTV